MPRFTPNPEAASAGPLILDKDDYSFEIVKASAFIFDKNPEKISHGVQFQLKIATEGQYKGKTLIARCFQHTPASEDMAKKFLLCAAGYDPNKKEDEERFNAEFGAKDWSYDTDDKSVGDGWASFNGKIIAGMAQEPKLADGGQMNQNINWKPYAP